MEQALPVVEQRADTHEIEYVVERPATGVVDTEVRAARRPFESRIETQRPGGTGDDDGARILDLEVFGGVEVGSLDQNRVLIVVPPRPALRSGLLTTDLAAAAGAGIVEPLGLGRTVAGEDCTEIRTGTVLDDGILRPPTPDAHTDVCVDRRGLVLREEQVVGGAVVVRRTAVDVTVNPSLADDAFTPLGYRIPEGNGGGRVRAVTADSRPPDVDHHEFPSAPPGFERLGRYGVATDRAPGPNAAGAVDQIVSIVDVLVDGGDVVTVENGAAVSGAPVLGRGDVDVALPYSDDATAVFLTTGVEIRVPLPNGRFVRLISTRSLAETVAFAASLVVVDGPGTVEPADDEPDVTGRFAPPADGGGGEPAG